MDGQITVNEQRILYWAHKVASHEPDIVEAFIEATAFRHEPPVQTVCEDLSPAAQALDELFRACKIDNPPAPPPPPPPENPGYQSTINPTPTLPHRPTRVSEDTPT